MNTAKVAFIAVLFCSMLMIKINFRIFAMKMIEQQAHFWELYQDNEHYYLSVAIDMSSVVSCWYLYLSQTEANLYQNEGRQMVDDLVQKIVQETYRGDFLYVETRQVSDVIQQAMLNAYKIQS